MKAKYKMTGCARFIIFLLFLVPIAYFGSKYLRDSGTWDDIKSKVENRDKNSVERTIEQQDDQNSYQRNDKLREALQNQEEIIENQRVRIEELERELEQLKGVRTRTNSEQQAQVNPPQTNTNTQPPTTTTNTDNPSLSDLLNEADGNVGTPTTPSDAPTAASSKTLGKWSFTYSNMRGQIEFVEQNGGLFSKIYVEGDSRVTIDELKKTGDRFNVIRSRTGEYYVLKINGDLDAYDQNGFQTTCRRINN